MTWLKRTARRRTNQGAKRKQRPVAFDIVEQRILLSTFNVTNNGDDPAPGSGSLRRAILDANAAPGLDDIKFTPSLGVITPATAFPVVTGPTTFNTVSPTTVVIDGAGANFDGLTLGAGSGGSSIEGLTIRDFGASTIHVQSNGNTIAGNTIGEPGGSDQIGVLIDGGSSNTIGGTAAAAANTIGFNQTAGVKILGVTATNNHVDGNFIGTNGANANRGNAIGVQVVNSSGNEIGGTAANTVGFNTLAGVALVSGSRNEVSQNRYISTNGPSPVSSSDINLGTAANNHQPAPDLTSATLSGGQLTLTFTIGLPAGTNVSLDIYKLSTAGVGQRTFVGTATATLVDGANSIQLGAAGLANGEQILATATVAVNGTSTLSNVAQIGNTSYTVTNNNSNGPGSLLQALTDANAAGGAGVINITFNPGIGVIDVSQNPLPPIKRPVDINHANTPGVVIDGRNEVNSTSTDFGFVFIVASAGNPIGSNGSIIQGLTIRDFAQAGIQVSSDGVTIKGNTIGAAGDPNGIGVLIDGGASNTIGGSTASAKNTIGFSSVAGIKIQNPAATHNVVQGNVVGVTGQDGGNAIGLWIVNSSENTIGGATGGAGNVFGYNTTAGVQIEGPSATANVVQGNVVGVSGLNGGNTVGVYILNAANNIVGGTAAAASNTIGYNTTAGVQIQGPSATANVVQGNVVGVSGPDGGNGYGVQINNASGNIIGGTIAGAPNTIGFSTSAGIRVTAGNQNFFQRNNYVGANGPLSPVAKNDIVLDPNANHNQPRPQLSTAILSPIDNTLKLPTALPAGYTIEIYRLLNGQRTYVTSGTTDANGDVTVTGIESTDQILATSSIDANGTSAFSNVTSVVVAIEVVNTLSTNVPGSLSHALSLANSQQTGSEPIGIFFNLGSLPAPHVIRVLAAAPLYVTRPLIINSTNAEDVVIDGMQEGTGFANFGFVFLAGSDGTTIQGLTIQNFAIAGIRVVSSHNEILNNIIGSAGAPNAIGVLIDGGSANSIGKQGFANTIGFNQVGVKIQGATATANVVASNLIGVNAENANIANGIGVQIDGSDGNIVGVAAAGSDIPGAPNSIKFNRVGVQIQNSTLGNLVTGNTIGVDAPIGGQVGVALINATGNRIGGASTDSANSIRYKHTGVVISGGSGNYVAGNSILGPISPGPFSGDVVGVFVYQSSGNVIGGASEPNANTIGLNDAGIKIEGGSGNFVEGNYIGYDGVNNISNIDGVWVVDSRDNWIGGTTIRAGNDQPVVLYHGNLIGDNSDAGVKITGATSTGNFIFGNYIGVDPFSPTQNRPANKNGVILASPGNYVGFVADPFSSPGVSYANVIGNNSSAGVWIQAAGKNNIVRGNYIGTDRNWNKLGNVNLGNDNEGRGILIEGAGNLVGQVDADSDFGYNVIGFNRYGVMLLGTMNQTSPNFVQGNYIGVSPQGEELGNIKTGVMFYNARYGVLGPSTGSTQPGFNNQFARNIISANGDGVALLNNSAYNVVAGNLIGAYKSEKGNRNNGVYMVNGTGNVIGGGFQGMIGCLVLDKQLFPTSANLITGNGNHGVAIFQNGAYPSSPSDMPNLVQGNQISRNVLNGVVLAGDFAGNLTQGRKYVQIDDNLIGIEYYKFFAQGVVDYFDPLNHTANPAATGNGLSGVLLLSGGNPANAAFTNSIVDVLANAIAENALSGIIVQALTVPTGETTSYLGYLARIRIAGNVVGLDLDGNATSGIRPFGNIGDGIRISQVVGLQIDALAVTDPDCNPTGAPVPNVVSANLGRGIGIDGSGLSAAVTTNPDMANRITGNYIGTNLAGAVATTGNLSEGVLLFNPGATTIDRNLIGGNRGYGIHAATQGQTGQTTGPVLIQNNRIGTNQGDSDLGNGADGVFLDRMPGNVKVLGNVISRNRANGINVQDSQGVVIAGNFIGLVQPSFSLFHGNSANGLLLNGSGGVVLGVAGMGNVISGNQASGVAIFGNLTLPNVGVVPNVVQGNWIGIGADGSSAIPNSNSGVIVSLSRGNLIGGETNKPGTGVGNVISGNQLYGVQIVGNLSNPGSAGFNKVQGNLIGTNTTGKSDLANSADGVFILNSPNNSIGGASQSQGNVISGNSAQGVRLFGAGTFSNSIAGNLIGLDVDGGAALPNRGNGVIVDNANSNIVGPGNVISGNLQSGVMLSSTLGPQAPGSWVAGNLIGTNRSGAAPIPNGGSGVLILGASNNLVGSPWEGGSAVYRNVISGNALDGVQIYSAAPNAPTVGNYVLGNYVGTDAGGSYAVGNQGDGVHIINGSSNVIGGKAAGAGNVISGNSNGVTIDMQATRSATNNVLDGNRIGTDYQGFRPIGNQHFGVLLNNAQGNLIGSGGTGWVPGTLVPATPSNVISGNIDAGVGLTGTAAGNSLRGNFIGVSSLGTAYDQAQNGLNLHNGVGVLIQANAVNNTVGGIDYGQGNIITQSGSNPNNQPVASASQGYVGVEITSPTATGNAVLGNMIGIDALNQVGFNSVGVLLINSQGTYIGRPTSQDVAYPLAEGAGNVISGNGLAGVEITGQQSTGNQIYNNFIGTDTTGARRPGSADPQLPNAPRNPTQESGVLILQGTGNRVGSNNAGNVISGNLIGVNIASQAASNNNTGANLVQNNKIGTDHSGTIANPNFEFGVFVTASSNNYIDRNLISANGLAGIEIFGGSSQLAAGNPQSAAGGLGNLITSNQIGTNIYGQVVFATSNGVQQIDSPANHPTVALPDGISVTFGFQQHGVVVIGASNNAVGLPGQGNLISGNILTGVYISRRDNLGNVYAVPTNNVVQSNQLNFDGIYGVFRYDAPNGNPVAEGQASNANTFTGTPIPIGDFVTGFNQTGLPGQTPKSILPSGTNASTTTASAQVASAPVRRSGLAARTSTNKLQIQAKPLSAAKPGSSRPRVPQLFAAGSRARRVGIGSSTS